jgi:ribosome-interacting GTPase 1
MKDLIHEKFAQLMDKVEALEDEIEQKMKDKSVSAQELLDFNEKLAEMRNELKRLSDGCGIH